MQIATGMGTDSHQSPVIDSEMTAEDLLPLAFRYVFVQMLKKEPGRFQDLLESHTISVTAGEGALPNNILTEYMDHSYLPDYPYSSRAQWLDYQRQKFSNLLCYWTYTDGRFLTTCTEGGPDPEDIVLHAVTVPELPPGIGDEIDITERDLEEFIYTLALAIRGEIKLI